MQQLASSLRFKKKLESNKSILLKYYKNTPERGCFCLVFVHRLCTFGVGGLTVDILYGFVYTLLIGMNITRNSLKGRP